MADPIRMEADKNLTADLNRTASFEEIRQLLENATVRSGIAERNPDTGRFVRREPLTPAARAVEPEEEKQVTKTEVIGGKEFEFTGTALEVERMIGDAYKVAEALKSSEPVAPASPARTTQDAVAQAEARLQLIRGEITPEQYLERTHAVENYLAERGFDVNKAAGEQYEASWKSATETFLRETPEGQTWKGGAKNLELMGNLIAARGLMDAPDKVAALRSLAAEMRAKGLEFDGDFTPEQINQLTDNATPQEILEAWKTRQTDPDSEIIREFGGSGGYSRGNSAIFGR